MTTQTDAIPVGAMWRSVRSGGGYYRLVTGAGVLRWSSERAAWEPCPLVKPINLLDETIFTALTSEDLYPPEARANKVKERGGNKYTRTVKGVELDVYDVLAAWNVTNPALQHLIKKALQCGDRGHKSRTEDLQDILASAKRAVEIG